MNDWRNEFNIELARLWPQASLEKKLPMKNVFIEEKLNGRRYSLEIGVGRTLFVSRGRHDATKGVAVSKSKSFVTMAPPAEFRFLETWGPHCVLDGEFLAEGESTASLAGRADTRKVFVVFDILVTSGVDVRRRPLLKRKLALEKLLGQLEQIYGSERMAVLKPHAYVEQKLLDQVSYDGLVADARERKLEGYVIKPMSAAYGRNIGFKAKPIVDSIDGVIVAAKIGKKHRLGEVSKTENVGVVGVTQYDPATGKTVLTAWVPWGGGHVPIKEKEKLFGRVVEFSASGWDAGLKRWAFPQFKLLREIGDKSPEDCTL